eukprot:5455013-Ditylum_brightwellii.AAC.1
MMESNPQMRELMDSNPELHHIMDDPELMTRSMEMTRNPTAMKSMIRNQDLALSQIENIPGGFSVLRRLYEDAQAPMMDAIWSCWYVNAKPMGNALSTKSASYKYWKYLKCRIGNVKSLGKYGRIEQ